MLIVSGHLIVDPPTRDDYLAGCSEVVRLGRAAEGCLDFALSPDLLDASRINIFERWSSPEAVEAFRRSGVPEGQAAQILSASVAEYDVTGEHLLT